MGLRCTWLVLRVFGLLFWGVGFVLPLRAGSGGFDLVISEAFACWMRARCYGLQVNQVEMDTVQRDFHLRTHYPGFDTVFFRGGANEDWDTVFTRFRPGEKYLVSIGCCDEGFEIWDSEKLAIMAALPEDASMEAFDSLRGLLYETGEVSFRLRHCPRGDTLVGLFLNFAAGRPIQLLTRGRATGFVAPSMGYYGTNRTWVLVGRPTGSLSGSYFLMDDELQWNDLEMKDFERLSMVQLRLFENERVRLIYDVRSGRMKMRIVR
jgi:hypothetical protein